jgi:sugar/nucleoside kinase (ribokinase family)
MEIRKFMKAQSSSSEPSGVELTNPEYLAFGDIGVDSLVLVDHLPRPDEKLWVEVVADCPGGMAANAAATYASLGGSAGLVSRVGRDDHGRIALLGLEARRVNVVQVEEVDEPTFWTLSLATPDGQRALVQFPTHAFGPRWDALDFSIIHGSSVVHSLAEQGPPVVELMAAARAADVATSLDIEYPFVARANLESLVSLVDMVFLNSEAAQYLDADPERAAIRVREMGAGTVAVTLGADGAVLADREGTVQRIRGERVDALDANGAGDAFAAAFAWARVREWPDLHAAEFANCVAAVATTRQCWDALGDREEIRALAGDRSWRSKL